MISVMMPWYSLVVLASNLSTEDYIKWMPSTDVLCNEFHTPHDAAFFLSRPMYAHHISSKYHNLKNQGREVNSSIKFISTSHHMKWWWLLFMKQWFPYMFPKSGMTSVLNSMPHSGHWQYMTLQFHIPAMNVKSINLKSRWKAIDDNQEMPPNKKRRSDVLLLQDKLLRRRK